MSVSNGLPKFTGFIPRLVEDGRMTAENMQQAMLSAKKAQQDIVPYLIEHHKLSPQIIAETISLEFGEPVFDLSVYDSAQILRDLVEDKLITKHRVLPIYRRGNILYIATSNPTNMDAMDAIRFNSKMNIEAIIVEHPQLEKLI